MLKIHQIEQVQIELTTRCNARCPMCMRNYRGYEYNSGYPVTELSLENIQHILQPDFLKQLYKGVSFNGNLGDFGLARDALKIVQWLVDQNVPVYINTNGSMRTPDWWAQLALPGVKIGFALDGLADTHHLYRLDTDWHRIIENARAYINAGGYALWRFIPFDHNRHQEAECKKLAKEYGFAEFENIDEGRNRGPVFTRIGEFSHYLGQPYPGPVNLTHLIESHISWFNPKTVKNNKDIYPHKISCLHNKLAEIYITADGSVFPCCFLGFYPEKMSHPGNVQLEKIVNENNALIYDLEHCIEWFDKIQESWDRQSIADGRLYQCINSCGRE